MAGKRAPKELIVNPTGQNGDFKTLLLYIDELARHKLGYPVSLLTYLGIVDNRILGISPGSLANVLLNNVGDPFKDSETSLMEVKRHERKLIEILEKYYGMPKDGARGYVTTGGTEGNFASLWWSKRYMINSALDMLIKMDNQIKLQTKDEQDLLLALAKIPNNDYQNRCEHYQKIIAIKDEVSQHKNIVQQLLTPTVFFTKGHTHYSIPKIAEILRLNIRPVSPNPDGSMDLNNFNKELLLHLSAHPHSAIIVVANIGTTITGAIDDIPGIKKIIETHPAKPKYSIHMDGALTGFVMPIVKPFGKIENYFDELGANTLAVSAHKYPGLSQPCGIILARREFFEKAFEKSERSIDYVGNILDVTITGSRSGLNVLMFYNALLTLELDKNSDKLTEMVHNNLDISKYLCKQLINLYGEENVSYPYHFNVTFPKPSAALARKYQLMLTGDKATICVLTNVTKDLIDQFIIDLQHEKEKVMATRISKTDYSILTLQKKHMKSAIKLFIKSFCDSEPITKHLHVNYDDYEPFATEVVEKAIKDGMSVVAVDDKDEVIACAIAEDIVDRFTPHLDHYPKLKPIFAILDELSKPFLNKDFKKGKIAHVWIAIVDGKHRGEGLSTAIDSACADLAVKKGFDFAYAEFTNEISEKIVTHYKVQKCLNTIKYENFTMEKNNKPFDGLRGGAAAYLIGIKPGIKMDALVGCYATTK